MSEFQLYIGQADQFISDSKEARRIVEALLTETKEWSKLISDVGFTVREILQDIKKYVNGEMYPGDPSNAAIIYRERGAGGASRGLNSGDYLTNFQDLHHQDGKTWVGSPVWVDWNDRVNAINVREGFFIAVYEHANFGGDKLIVIGSARLHNLPGINWGDKISSAMVYPIKEINRTW